MSKQWPKDDSWRAFVAGAMWWEWASTGFTMWASDQDKAIAEADRRYTKAGTSTRTGKEK